jgi:hypothetical protein
MPERRPQARRLSEVNDERPSQVDCKVGERLRHFVRLWGLAVRVALGTADRVRPAEQAQQCIKRLRDLAKVGRDGLGVTKLVVLNWPVTPTAFKAASNAPWAAVNASSVPPPR